MNFGEPVELLLSELWDAAKLNAEMNENFMSAAFFLHHDPQGQLTFAVQPVAIIKEKDVVAAVIREIAAEIDAFGVFFLCESWAITNPDEVEKYMRGEIEIAKSDHRQEMLTGVYSHRRGNRQYSAKIDRSSGRKRVDAEEIVDGEFAGLFSNFIPSAEVLN
jgi:hypothetical protein